jgi:hypothetical protein
MNVGMGLLCLQVSYLEAMRSGTLQVGIPGGIREGDGLGSLIQFHERLKLSASGDNHTIDTQEENFTDTNMGIGTLLTPDNCTMLLIDYEPQMFFGAHSIDRQLLANNVIGLAKAAKLTDRACSMRSLCWGIRAADMLGCSGWVIKTTFG